MLALGAPLFPLGNDARSAAVLYGGLALAWVVLTWREARFGLLFVAGPLLAPLGALALLPLVVQPVRSPFLRGAQAAVAVLAAGFVTAIATGSGLSPASSVTDVAAALWAGVVTQPAALATALVAAATAIALPWVRRMHRFGVAAIGVVLVATAVATGSGPLGVLITTACWGAAGAARRRITPVDSTPGRVVPAV